MPAPDIGWNPWHGCRKLSAGCLNCYVFRMDARHERDASLVKINRDFTLPVRRARGGGYKIPSGTQVATCFSSDFLLEDADAWRPEAFAMMRERSDLRFFFITKRIDRLEKALPGDWGSGYPNVHIGCTCENQDRADYHLPIFLSLPIVKRTIVCEPLLTKIDLSPYLDKEKVDLVAAGGESGENARVCRYGWILALRDQCAKAGVPFWFRQTGARFEKDGRLYRIPRSKQSAQAKRAQAGWSTQSPQPDQGVIPDESAPRG